MTTQNDKLQAFDLYHGARDLGEWTDYDEANRWPHGAAIAVLLVFGAAFWAVTAAIAFAWWLL